jgi:hypothetical protein
MRFFARAARFAHAARAACVILAGELADELASNVAPTRGDFVLLAKLARRAMFWHEFGQTFAFLGAVLISALAALNAPLVLIIAMAWALMCGFARWKEARATRAWHRAIMQVFAGEVFCDGEQKR